MLMARIPVPKNPRLAGWLSAVPGLGQLYNGQPGRAVIAFGGTLGFFAIAFLFVEGPNVLLPAVHAGGLVTILAGLVGVLLFLTFLLAGMTFWYIAFHDALLTARDLQAGRESTGRWWFFHR
jgi:TM2 domain-containing membrane protein YozV